MVQKFAIDFQTKEITILLERWLDGPEPERISVRFTGVALQDFKDFNTLTPSIYSPISRKLPTLKSSGVGTATGWSVIEIIK
jgi:hypothetical protein